MPFRPHNLQAAVVHSVQRRQRRERRHDKGRAPAPVSPKATRRTPAPGAPVTTTTITLTTTASAGTITATSANLEYRCAHCNYWLEEHVGAEQQCLFAPTQYATPLADGRIGTECRYTVQLTKEPLILPAGAYGCTLTTAGGTLNLWGTAYTVKP